MQIRRVNNIVHIYPIQFTIESVHDHRVHIIMFKYSMCICYGQGEILAVDTIDYLWSWGCLEKGVLPLY